MHGSSPAYVTRTLVAMSIWARHTLLLSVGRLASSVWALITCETRKNPLAWGVGTEMNLVVQEMKLGSETSKFWCLRS